MKSVQETHLQPSIGKLEDLRPLGTIFKKTLPAAPLDPRARARVATYQVVKHEITSTPGIYREVVVRTKLE